MSLYLCFATSNLHLVHPNSQVLFTLVVEGSGSLLKCSTCFKILISFHFLKDVKGPYEQGSCELAIFVCAAYKCIQ